MICPKCRFEQPGGRTECIKCGIVFEKYLAARKTAHPARDDYASPGPGREEIAESEGSFAVKLPVASHGASLAQLKTAAQALACDLYDA